MQELNNGQKSEAFYDNGKIFHRIVYDKSGNKNIEFFWEYKDDNLSYFKRLDSDGTILEEYYKSGKFYRSVKTYKDGRKEEKNY